MVNKKEKEIRKKGPPLSSRKKGSPLIKQEKKGPPYQAGKKVVILFTANSTFQLIKCIKKFIETLDNRILFSTILNSNSTIAHIATIAHEFQKCHLT